MTAILRPKVRIGCRYEPPHFVRRDRDGSYSAKMPEATRDGLRLQAALLDIRAPRPSRITAVGALNMAAGAAIIFCAIALIASTGASA